MSVFPNVGFNLAVHKCRTATSDVEGVSWVVKCLFLSLQLQTGVWGLHIPLKGCRERNVQSRAPEGD